MVTLREIFADEFPAVFVIAMQANNCRPLSESVFREFGFRLAIDTSTLF